MTRIKTKDLSHYFSSDFFKNQWSRQRWLNRGLCFKRMLVRHVYPQHGIKSGKKIRLFQRTPLDRIYRPHMTTCQYFLLSGNTSFSKTNNPLRQERYFSRFFSSQKIPKPGTTAELIDGTIPTLLTVELPANEDKTSENNDLLATILATFPKTIERNVNDIIAKVDTINDPSDEASNSAQSIIGEKERLAKKNKTQYSHSERKFFRKRWERLLRTEIERYHRRNRNGSNRRKFQREESSVEAQWEYALRRNGYSIWSREKRCKRGLAFNTFGIVDDPSEIEKENEESSGDFRLSPIFRFEVDRHQDLVDFNTPNSIEEKDCEVTDDRGTIEVKHLEFSQAIDDERTNRDSTDMHNKAILKSISLLMAMKPDDWKKHDSSIDPNEERFMQTNRDTAESSVVDDGRTDQGFVINHSDLNQFHNKRPTTQQFLRLAMEHKYSLTTPLVNLLLANLVTSTELENKEIGDGCLRIFKEIKLLAESGQSTCIPDSTTYRILILAFTQRFQGVGEAVKLSQEMVEESSIDINPELLNEALRACRTKGDLTVARMLMNSPFTNERIKINAGSCIIYTEMLKIRNLDKEAIDLFCRISKANLLSQGGEDEYLISLCRWSQRSRRGDVLDLSSFWTDILSILERKTLSSKMPDIRAWISFLEGLYSSAKSDDSLWKMTAGATRRILDSYPNNFVGRKLMTIGLDASSSAKDPELASLILERLADEPVKRYDTFNSMEHDSQAIVRRAKVPFRAVKNSLNTCLETSDAKSARSIRESLDKIGDPYPAGAKSELYSLVLMCHTGVNDVENAKHVLEVMIEKNMKPSESLYGEVLHTMAVAGRYQEMEEMFTSMLKGKEGGIKPGISSYDAVLSARIKKKSWEDVISLYDQMKANGIIPSSRTIKGLIVANNHTGGRELVTSTLSSLLLCNAQFDESVFRVASVTLFKEVDSNLDDFRNNIREIGEHNQKLKSASFDLVRSIRSAEIESSRPKAAYESKYETKDSGEEAWRLATSHLLAFVQVWSESNDDVES